MISKEKIERINELARKAKESELTPAEKDEQLMLRREYLASVRESLKCQLDNIEFVEDKQKN